MADQLPKFNQKTLPGFGESICLGGSQGGIMPSTSPDGETLQSGPAHALVSRSAKRGSEKAPPTNATSGPSSSDSSPSADLQRSLENRLRARLDVNGSPEYVLTWKHWDMLSGPPICALRGRARRTSDSGCSGWPTPRCGDTAQESIEAKTARNKRLRAAGYTKGCGSPSLATTATLTGWPTPDTMQSQSGHGTRGGKPGNGSQSGASLASIAKLTGWATPTAVNHRSPKSNQHGKNSRPLQEQAGTTSIAETAKLVASPTLNPAFSRWLMGFPENWDRHSPGWDKWVFVQQELTEWDGCEDTATRSCRS